MLYLFRSLLKIPNSPLSWEIESKKTWPKQPKAAPALDFLYFQHVSKLVTHDRKSWFLAKSGLFPHFCVQYLTCHFFWPKRWPQRGRIAESTIPRQRECYPLSLPLHAWPRSLHGRRCPAWSLLKNAPAYQIRSWCPHRFAEPALRRCALTV